MNMKIRYKDSSYECLPLTEFKLVGLNTIAFIRNHIYLGPANIVGQTITPTGSKFIEIRFKQDGQTTDVPFRDILVVIKENKTEENKMLINGYKIVKVALTCEVGNVPYVSERYTKALAATYMDVGVGDEVVVIRNVERASSFEFAKVIEIGYKAEETNQAVIEYEVVDKVNATDYEKRQSRAQEAECLKKQMDVEIEKMKEQAAYEAFAEKNPALAEMLNAYNCAIGNTPNKAE